MYGRHMVILRCLVLSLAACGPNSAQDEPPSPTDTQMAGDEALRNDIYDAAVEACEAFPPRRNEDPVTAAEDYADGYQEQFEQAAFDGCLEGFRRAGAIP